MFGGLVESLMLDFILKFSIQKNSLPASHPIDKESKMANSAKSILWLWDQRLLSLEV